MTDKLSPSEMAADARANYDEALRAIRKLPFLGRKLDDLTKPEDRETVHVPICGQGPERAREPKRLVPRFVVPTGLVK